VDEDDGDHDASLELLESHPGPLLVPQLVTAEVAYLIESRLGWIAETRFLGDLPKADRGIGLRALRSVSNRLGEPVP
jgi:predicted nucleic acid-binding protein